MLLFLLVLSEPLLLFLEEVELSHSQEEPDKSWSSIHGWLEVPLAIPELADTRSPSW